MHGSEVEVPIKFIKYLIADYYDAEDNCRILVFADEENLKLIREIEELFLDGTFKSVPSPFYQLVTVPTR